MHREAEVEVVGAISLEELYTLPEDAVLQSWREYSLSLDSNEVGGMRFDKKRRLLAALGTGSGCAQMFSNDQKIFLGPLKGNKKSEEIVQEIATNFLLSFGEPPEGFRALRDKLTQVLAAFCKGKANVCKVGIELPDKPQPDTCETPQQFCTKVMACAAPESKPKAPQLEGKRVVCLQLPGMVSGRNSDFRIHCSADC